MAAAANNVIATAAIGLIPVMTGAERNISAALSSTAITSQADRAGRNIGQKMASSAMSALKTGLKVGGVVTAAVGAMTIKGGLDRALGIEDARAQMSGLGHDTKSVEKIMGNALASVEGTAFGLDAAATTAAGAVAAGIKPGEQLEQTLKTVANTAAGAKAPMEEIGGIFNTVAAVGKAYTGDINMIAQRGIPIWQSLSKQLGVSQEDVQKMASNGQIDFATFERAAADAAGGVALAMGDTTRGAFSNMMASVRKLGAMFMTGVLPLAKTAFQGVQGLLNAVKAKLEPFVQGFFDRFGGPAQAGIQGFFDGLISRVESFDPTPVVNFFKEVQGGITAFGAAWHYNDGEVTSSGFPGFMERAAYAIHQVWDAIKVLDFSSLTGFFGSLGGIRTDGITSTLSGMGEGFGQIAGAAPGVISIGVEALGGAMQFLSDHSDTVVKLLPYIVAGFVAFKVATQAQAGATQALMAADIASLPVQIARNATSFAAAVARRSATTAEYRLTAATNANTVASGRATIAERARTIATKAGAIASKVAAGATRLLGAAIRFATGPIGLIITGVTLLVGALVWFFTQTETGKGIWETVWTAIKGAAASVVDWFTGTALPYLQAAWDGIAAGALWLYENAILPAWSGIQAAIAAVGTWITGTLCPALQTAWSAIGTAVMWLWNSVIQPAWAGIKLAIAIAVTAVLLYIDLLKFYFTNVIAPVALWLWQNVMKPAWNGIQVAIGAVVAWVQNTAWPILKAVWDAIAAATTWLWQNVMKPAWAGIQIAINAVVSWFQNTAWPILKSVIAWITGAFNTMRDALQMVWFKIRMNIINPVIIWFLGTAWPVINTVIGYIKTGFNVMRDSLRDAWNFVKDKVIQPVVNWFENTLEPKIDGVTGNISTAFDTMKEGIKTAWDAVKDAARTPVRFVVEDVYNDTLRSTFNGVADKLDLPAKWRLPLGTVGFATGGIMPGYTPGRDVHRFFSPTAGVLDLSGGEPILRPEAGRVLGPDWVHGINRAARAGGTEGVRSFLGGHQAFAGGGIWQKIKGIGGDTWDWITDKASTIAEAITDPFGVLTKLAGKVTELIPGGGMVHAAAVQTGKNAGEMLGDWLKSQLEPVTTDGSTTPVVTRGGGSLSLARQLASQHGLSFTSGYRPGARTKRTGIVSYHALGRAHDYAAPMTTDGKRRMMAFFNAMHPYKPTELLHSPAGGRQWRRTGRQANTTGSTYRGHFDHVHVAFKKGGHFGDHMGVLGGKSFLYDKGGEIPPGVRVVANKHSRPEKVLPPAESDALTALAKRGGGDQHFHYSPQQVDLDHEIERRTRREFEAMAHAAQEVMGT